MIQHELTNQHYWFIHARGTGHKPDHTDALYHMPGGRVARRFALLKAFPDLKDSTREVESLPAARAPDPQQAEAEAMYAEGIPVAQIAYRLSRHKRTIYRWLGLAA